MFQRVSKVENAFLSFWILSIIDISVGREYLDHDSFFRTLYSTLVLWPWNWPPGKPSCPLCVSGLLLVLVCMCRRWRWETTPFSQEVSLWCHQSRYPGRSSGLKSQSVLQSKIGQKNFQIYFFLQRKDSKNSVVKEGVLSLETFVLSCNVSLGCERGCDFSEFLALCVSFTPGRDAGRESKSKPHDSLRTEPRLK